MKRKILALALLVFYFGLPCTVFAISSDPSIEFVDIPGNGKDVKPFKMAKTEVTNQQYVNFLNAAFLENKITVGEIKPTEPMLLKGKLRIFRSKNQQLVYYKGRTRILNLLNQRAVGDQNEDGKLEVWEYKNPLNRCMIEFDSSKKKFRVVDPKKVDWNIYFDNKHLPPGKKTTDSITNWAELHEFWPKGVPLKGRKLVTWAKGDYGKDVLFAGIHDSDFKLPTLEEVKTWPVNHIEYKAAKAFADFYGFTLPTYKQFKWAKAGGKGYKYGTADGTISNKNVIYNGHSLKEYPKLANGRMDIAKFPGEQKGHVQPVASFAPNPYGVYDLSGNVVEWTKTRNSPKLNCIYKGGPPGFEAFIALGGGYAYWKEAQSTDMKCRETPEFVNNDHFGLRVVKKNN